MADLISKIKDDSNTAHAIRAGAIPKVTVDSTSTATAFTVTNAPGIIDLVDGVCIYITNNKIASAENCTLNVNSKGAKPIYMSNASGTRVTTQWALNTTCLFVYNSTRVTNGCWDLVVGYNTNTTYSSKAAASGGTDVSLCTTGEKYTWNSKQNALTRPVTGAATWSAADVITVTNAASGNVIKASGKTIATSVTDVDTTVPTSKAVKTFVEGKGYLTSHQTIKQDGITGATVNRFGTCSTAAATAAKTVSITTGTFSLEAGARVSVKFSNANTADSPTLNVASKGAKNIFHKGSQITTGGNKALLAGTVDFIYDGTQWHLVGNYIDTNTTYTPASSASKVSTTSAAGTATTYSRGDHVHGIDLATGDNDGQVKIAGTNVSVKGLASAAYTESSAYATSGHTHTLSIAADSGTSALSMAANTKYKLTAGGKTFIFTTPADGNTDTKVNVTLATTTKAYLLGTSTTPTSTATGVTALADTGVYLDTTAGKLTATTFAGSLSGTATSANILNNNTSVTATSSGLQYTKGGITIGTADGNAAEGSNASYKLWSYPAGGTTASSTSANIQNIRCYWSTTYFRDIFISPNNNDIYHRAVSNGNAQPWRTLLDTENLEKFNKHNETVTKVYDLTNTMGPVERSIDLYNSANKLALIPGANISVEYSTNSGSNWTDMGLTADQKATLFNDSTAASVYVGPNTTADRTTSMQTRITVTNDGRDCVLDQIFLYGSTSYQSISMDIQVAYGNATTTFSNWKTGITAAAMKYQIMTNLARKRFGSDTSSSYVNKIRFIIKYTAVDSNHKTDKVQIKGFAGFGGCYWGGAVKNTLMLYNHLYKYDNSKNATFPAGITATSFTGPLTGNVTGDCSGTAANVTGTVAIANGGTGATSRLNALKALTDENVGTSATYFLTITNSWGKGGYTSVDNAKTVLGLKSAAYTESSAYATSGHTHSTSIAVDGSSGTGIILTANTKYKLTAGGTSQIFVTPADTSVTSSTYHYTPATASGSDVSASASGATAAWSIDVVKGVTLNTDGKGHVTGMSVTSGKIPANPNTNTIPSAYCSTGAATAAKVASCSGYVLLSKSFLHVIITETNAAVGALTLNVNSKGAKPIYINGSASSSSNYSLPAGSYLVYYNGTNYYFRTDGKLTASITGNCDGTAAKATKINTSALIGNTNKPVYVKADGTIAAISYEVNSNVPSNAVFTDTNNKVTQTNTTTNASYRVLLSNGSNDTTETVASRKSTGLRFNPGSAELFLSGSSPVIRTNLSGVDASKTNNNISSIIYPSPFNITDSSARILARNECFVDPNGNIGSKWYVRNYNTSGTQTGQGGITIYMNKSGTLSYEVDNPSAFKTALGLSSKGGGGEVTSSGIILYDNVSGDATSIDSLEIPSWATSVKVFLCDDSGNSVGKTKGMQAVDILPDDGTYFGVMQAQPVSDGLGLISVELTVATGKDDYKSIAVTKTSAYLFSKGAYSTTDHKVHILKVIAY